MLQTPSVSKKLKTVETRSSSSLSPSRKHLQTPPPMVNRRRTEQTKRDMSFRKRLQGLVRKIEALCILTGARAAVIVFSKEGDVYSFGYPSAEEVIREYLRGKSVSMLPKGPREGVDWDEKELDSCAMEEGLDSLKARCETVLDRVRKKLEEVGAGVYSTVGVCCGSEVSNHDEIDSLLENFNASPPALSALFKDNVRHVGCESYMTPPVNLAAGGGSSGAESALVHSLIEGCTYNAASGGSSSRKHLQTPPPMAKRRRRTEIAKITDPAKLSVTFCKRRQGLSRKIKALCKLTAARAAVIVFSKDKNRSFGELTKVISEYLRCHSGLMQPKGLREVVDWVEKELDSCATEEGLVSLIVTCEAVLDSVRKKLEEVGAGGHSPVGVSRDSERLSDDEIDSLLQNFKASRPSLFPLFKDYVRHGDCERYMTSPINLAAGGGSSGAESAPVHSLIEGCTYNAGGGGSSGVASILTCFDLEGRGFNPNNFVNLSEDCIGAGDRGGLLTLPENLAVGDGSSRERSGHSDLKGCGYNPDDFAALEDLGISLAI